MIKIIISMLLKNRKNLQKMIIQLRRPPVFVFLIMLFIVVFGPLLAPYDPLEPKPMNTLAAPSWDHWFGTDNYGFDILSSINTVYYGFKFILIYFNLFYREAKDGR